MQVNRKRAYVDCAIAGATPIGLMVALFDRLALDLRRAAAAIRTNDIEARCREMNHAFMIVGQLDSWVDLDNGGEPARQISAFYAQLRSAMIQASIQQSASSLDEQIDVVLRIRSKWQERDLEGYDRVPGSASNIAYPPPEGASGAQRVSLSLSA